MFSALESCLRRDSLGSEVAGVVVATETWGGKGSMRIEAMLCTGEEAELSRG